MRDVKESDSIFHIDGMRIVRLGWVFRMRVIVNRTDGRNREHRKRTNVEPVMHEMYTMFNN